MSEKSIIIGLIVIAAIIIIALIIKTKKKCDETTKNFSDDSGDLNEFLVDETSEYKKVVFPQEVHDDEIDNSPKGAGPQGKNVMVYETPEIKKEVINKVED